MLQDNFLKNVLFFPPASSNDKLLSVIACGLAACVGYSDSLDILQIDYYYFPQRWKI